MKGLAFRTRGLVAEGLHQMSQSSSSNEIQGVRERWANAQASTRARQEKRFASLEVIKEARGPLAAGRSRSSSPNDSDESARMLRGQTSSDESALEEAGCLVGASGSVIAGRATSDFENLATGTIGQRAPTETEHVLAQLTTQPQNDVECAAKFALYEAYSTEVEDMRDTIMKFHEESKPLLPEALEKSMNEQIRGIDSREAMTIPERTVEWFVYHMMRKAEQNNLSMASKLESFEKKIKYLAESCQIECPVCLEPFEGENKRSETLSCCHKICTDCWTRWSVVMHGLNKHPFCPVCNHSQFLNTVNAETGGPVDLSDSDSGYPGDRSCTLFGCGQKTDKTGYKMKGDRPKHLQAPAPIQGGGEHASCAAIPAKSSPRTQMLGKSSGDCKKEGSEPLCEL